MANIASTISLNLETLGFLAALKVVKDVGEALITTQREFDKINASLITVTGSTEKAAEAFLAIQDFAAKTPFDLKQVAESFSIMANMGMKTGTEWMTVWGDLAAGTGHSMKQVILAVDDATRGSNERLKELGITSKVSGDQVTYALGGITKTVSNNANDIQEALKDLTGKFSGGMENMNKTLDGQMSNLADNFDKFKLSLAQSGFGDEIGEQVAVGNEALATMTDYVKSGEFVAAIATWAIGFKAVEKDIEQTLDITTAYIDKEFAAWKYAAGVTGNFMGQALGSNMLNNIRTFIQITTVEVGAFLDNISVRFNAQKDKLSIIGSEIGKGIFEADPAAAGEAINKIEEAAQIKLKGIQQAKLSAADTFLAENAQSVKRIADIKTEATEKRKIYDDAETARKANKHDILSDYSGDNSVVRGKKSGAGSAEHEAKAAEAAAKRVADAESRYAEHAYQVTQTLELNKQRILAVSQTNAIIANKELEKAALMSADNILKDAKLKGQDLINATKQTEEIKNLIRIDYANKEVAIRKKSVDDYNKIINDSAMVVAKVENDKLTQIKLSNIAAVKAVNDRYLSEMKDANLTKNQILQLEKAKASEIAAINKSSSAEQIRISGSYSEKMKQQFTDISNSSGSMTDQMTTNMKDLTMNGIDTLATGMSNMATTGKAAWADLATGMIKQIEMMIAKMLIMYAIQQLVGMVSSGGGNAGAAAGNATNGGGWASQSSMGFSAKQADGGLWNGGVQMFADGGIVNSPTAFGMAGGKVGVAGEAGPEAIIPLKSGSVPVQLTGNGSSGGVNIENLNVTVQSTENETSAEQANKIGKAVREQLKQLIDTRIVNAGRSGNSLNPTQVRSAF